MSFVFHPKNMGYTKKLLASQHRHKHTIKRECNNVTQRRKRTFIAMGNRCRTSIAIDGQPINFVPTDYRLLFMDRNLLKYHIYCSDYHYLLCSHFHLVQKTLCHLLLLSLSYLQQYGFDERAKFSSESVRL